MSKYSEVVEKGIEKLRNLGRNDYIEWFEGKRKGGSETGTTSITNRGFFDLFSLKMKMIDSKEADTSIELFDCSLDTPIMSGAMSGMGNIEKNPMVKIAKGLKEAGSTFWMGIGGNQQLKSAIEEGVPAVKISKPYKDNEKIIKKIGFAEEAGAVAVGVDIDFFYGGKIGDKLIRKKQMGPKTLEEIKDIVSTVDIPFVVKGVLSKDDAIKAYKAGASAIVVSNHGAHVLDHASHPLEILPKIVDVLGEEMDLIADSGFRRGTDVLKGLALGARGILLGISTTVGLAAGGSDGVKSIFKSITRELRRSMSLTGCSKIREIDESILKRRPLII